MTISYNLDVASVSSFTFLKLLLRWRGSIWKSVKSELILWILAYYAVFCIYRYALNASQQRQFEKIAYYCNSKLDYIPLTFMLAFFVNIIADRWRKFFSNMGWIENLALTLTAVLRSDPAQEAEAKLMRRSVIRYMILSQILVYRDISMQVRRRFPDVSSIVKEGFMFEHEHQMYEDIQEPAVKKYWLPVNWAVTILARARDKNYIADAPSYSLIVKELITFRTHLAMLCNYDWVPIPIAYPQVVFLAVRSYFLICLVSRQFLIGDGAPSGPSIDIYVPVMTILQFLFFVAWMKVAEALLNPLGEDDDDFECNFLINRNITIGMAIVDHTAGTCPEMTYDTLPNHDVTNFGSKDYGGDHALVGSVADVVLTPVSSTANFTRLGSVVSTISSRRSSTQHSRRSTLSEKGRTNKIAPMSVHSTAKDVTDTPIDTDDITPAEFQRKHSSTKSRPSMISSSLTTLQEESENGKDSLDGNFVTKL
ncbi:Bestrophin [Trichostrongylus colubriformis]|uniref:Bestrophin homolog n=1 Tax=Trichostrongylus colubriformis TaxID=6319 RepID=A0AAN8IQL9_TRICO